MQDSPLEQMQARILGHYLSSYVRTNNELTYYNGLTLFPHYYKSYYYYYYYRVIPEALDNFVIQSTMKLFILLYNSIINRENANTTYKKFGKSFCCSMLGQLVFSVIHNKQFFVTDISISCNNIILYLLLRGRMY